MPLHTELQLVLGEGFTVERELGGGGMSRVFLALDRALGRRIVVKVLAPDLAAGVNRERFEREVVLSAQLQHPNIVTVLATGVLDGLPFYTMPFVEGESLRATLAGRGALPAAEAVPLLRDVARALAFAHARGVVHRDIKPDNVLLSGGAAMVTDFGVAKALSAGQQRAHAPTRTGDSPLTALGTSLGTLTYMAPEQAAADPDVDHRADIYSFGAMAYEMLAGRAPFDGLPPRELLTAIVAREPAPLDERCPTAPPALVSLVHRCLAKSPDERPQGADLIVAALEGVFTASGSLVAPPGARRAPRAAWVGAGVLVVFLAAGWGVLQARRGAPPAASTNTLAVLPLSTGAAGDGYFADGITDELTTALARVPSLRVASSASAFAVRERAGDLRAVARELGVANLLTGSLRRGGDRVRVTVQLTGADDGLVRWAESYEHEARDIFAVQGEIARSIAAALQLAFQPGPAQVADTAAYDLYLRGRAEWRRRGEASLRLAAGYFGQAIARDSSFARAWAGLADALCLLPVYGPVPADSVLPLVEQAAARALALDSSLAEAHAARGQLYKSLGRWQEADQAFARAVAADSSYASAFQWQGELYAVIGRPDAALAAMEHARRLDPLSPIITGELGYIRALAGRGDSAVAAGRRAIALGPELWTGYAFLGSVHLWRGEATLATPLLAEAMRRAPRNPFGGVLAYAEAQSGDRASALRRVRSMEAEAAAGRTSPASLAIGLVGIGEFDAAVEWLERAHAAHDGMLYNTPLNAPWFAPLWGLPRFTRFRETLALGDLPAPALP